MSVTKKIIDTSNMPTIKVGRPLEPTRFVFPIRPQPKERARSFQKGKKIGHTTPTKTRSYEDTICGYAALQHPFQAPFEGDLRVFITFFFQNRVHGDLDNLCKSIFDAIQARMVYDRRTKKKRQMPGVVMKNDKQIKAMSIAFIYRKGQQERTEMIVDRYHDEDLIESLNAVPHKGNPIDAVALETKFDELGF